MIPKQDSFHSLRNCQKMDGKLNFNLLKRSQSAYRSTLSA